MWLMVVCIVLAVWCFVEFLYAVYFSTQVFNRSKVDIPELFMKGDDSDHVPPASTSMVAGRTLVLAGKAIQLVPAMFWSILTQVIVTLCMLGAWFTIAFFLISSGVITQDTLGVSHLKADQFMQYSLAFHTVAFVWMMELADVVVAIVAGGVVAIFVFAATVDGKPNSDDRILPTFPLWHSFLTMGKYHLGTMVAAATCIMFLRPIRGMTGFVLWIKFGSGVPNSRWDQIELDTSTWLGMLESWWRTYIHSWTRGSDKRAVVQTVLHGTPFF